MRNSVGEKCYWPVMRPASTEGEDCRVLNSIVAIQPDAYAPVDLFSYMTFGGDHSTINLPLSMPIWH